MLLYWRATGICCSIGGPLGIWDMLHTGRFLAFHRARVAIRVPVQSETKVLRVGMQYLTLASALTGRDPSTPRMLSVHLDCVRSMEDLLVRRSGTERQCHWWWSC